MHTLEDLDGINVARAIVRPDNSIELTLTCPAYNSDGVRCPAESFTINSIEGIRTLGEVCAQMLATHADQRAA